ncbi:MAG TPA: hypothetical protein DDY49_07990 [Paenibacillaceae bacterium]|nr:hypothetical protein [Paenibacillaceae bacterium]
MKVFLFFSVVFSVFLFYLSGEFMAGASLWERYFIASTPLGFYTIFYIVRTYIFRGDKSGCLSFLFVILLAPIFSIIIGPFAAPFVIISFVKNVYLSLTYLVFPEKKYKNKKGRKEKNPYAWLKFLEMSKDITMVEKLGYAAAVVGGVGFVLTFLWEGIKSFPYLFSENVTRSFFPLFFFIVVVLGIIAYHVGKVLKEKYYNPGLIGEKSTEHHLKFLGDGYRVFHNLDVFTSSGQKQQLDHLIVGPKGVIHIDSKHYKGEIIFTDHGMERSTKSGGHDPSGQMMRHEQVMKKVLREHNFGHVQVTGIINFTHPHCTLIGSSPSFITVTVDRLLTAIHELPDSLSREHVKKIVQIIKTNSKESVFNKKVPLPMYVHHGLFVGLTLFVAILYVIYFVVPDHPILAIVNAIEAKISQSVMNQ